MKQHTQSAESKDCQTRILYPAKLPSTNEGKLKINPDKQKLREFVGT